MKDKKRKGKKKPARDSVSQVVNVYVTRKQAMQKKPSAPAPMIAPIQFIPRQGYTFEPLVKPASAQVVPADNRLETLLRQMEERMKPIPAPAPAPSPKQEAERESERVPTLREPTREMIAEASSSSGGESSTGPATLKGSGSEPFTASSGERDRIASLVLRYGRSDLIASLSREQAREIAQQLGENIKTKVGKKKTTAEEARAQLSAIIEEKRQLYNLP